jgi:hypothetical protein
MSLTRKLNNDKFHYLHSTPNIIRLKLTYVLLSATTNITSWEEFVGCTKEKNCTQFRYETPKERDYLKVTQQEYAHHRGP